MKLRFYQSDAAQKVREMFRLVAAVLLVLATGAGKTVIFSYITTQAAMKGRRVLVLAHRDMLLKQASAKLKANGVDHGLIMAAYTPSFFKPVQVASVQTLVRRLDKINQGFDIIVIDEAHLSSTPSYLKVIEHLVKLNPKTKILGVTATARRLDGKGLGKKAGGLFDDMVVGISFRDLVRHRFLLRPVVYASPTTPNAYDVDKKGSDLDMDEVAKVMDKPVITGNAIAHWRRICPGAPAVAWCANVKHAEHVAAEFNAAGIPAVALSGEDDSAERDRALAKLASGEIKVITFAMLLVEGVDCPAIKCVILLRPTLSLVSYLQTVGRGSRPVYADGYDMETIEGRHEAMLAGPKGDHFYVLDHAGLTFKHGFADDEREWSLDGQVKKGKKKKDEDSIGLKQCTQCFLVHEPAPQCPSCGFVYPIRQRSLEEVDGELEEITPEIRQQMAIKNRADQGKARTAQELIDKLGYSPDRANHIANARAEKDALRDGLIADFQKWRTETGESSLSLYNVALSDLKTYKPKALKELKARFDAYRAEQQAA